MDQVQTDVDSVKPLVEQMNDEFRKKVLPVTIFVGIEVVLGFFGNLLVLYVFLFRYHVCNFRYFVLCLAFTDITSTLTTMPGEMVTQLYWYVYPISEVCKVKSFFNMFTVSAEALCLLTIAIDRYRKVCKPFGWQIKPKGALIIILVIYTISLILAMPVPFLWGISFHQETYRGVNVTATICEKDGKYKLTKRPLQYSITMEAVLLICLIAMFVLYVHVARTLLKKKRRRRWSARVDAMIPSSSFHDSTSNTFQMKAIPSHSETACISNIESSRRKRSFNTKKTSGKEHHVTIFRPSEQCSTGGNHVINFKRSEQRSSDEHQVNISNHCEERSSDEHPVTTFKPNIKYGLRHAPLTTKVKTKSPTVSTDYDIPTDESRGVTTDEDNVKAQTRNKSRPKRSSRNMRTKVRRKTLIMFVLTITFTITTVLYLTLLSFIARADDVIHKMSHSWKAVYFFAFRLYFINHVINPVVYGILDPYFRKGLLKR